jgi:hypothetical protein
MELSEPGAVVLVIDRALNRAVANVRADERVLTIKLPAGDYQLQVAKDGFEAVSVNVSLRAWKRTRVAIELPHDRRTNIFRGRPP